MIKRKVKMYKNMEGKTKQITFYVTNAEYKILEEIENLYKDGSPSKMMKRKTRKMIQEYKNKNTNLNLSLND